MDADSCNHVTVTSEGVAVPIRFVVRLVGSVPLSADDRGTSGSKSVGRHVRRLCQRHHSDSSDLAPPSNVVYYWHTVSLTVVVMFELYELNFLLELYEL